MIDFCLKFFKTMTKKTACLFALLILLLSCTKNANEFTNTLFTKLSNDEIGITFSNNITPSEQFNIFNYRNFYNGGGVAIGDINNDGLPDIYFTSNQGTNKLYLNKGDFQFEDITESAGVAGDRPWTTGVTMADVNGDSLLDIYVLNSADMQNNNRENELFINQGDLTFKEEAKKYSLNDNAFSVHASFFDYDGDGDLDCYLLNNSFQGTGANMRRLLPKARDGGLSAAGGDKLLRNDGGLFTDVSQQAGIYQGEIGFGLGAIVGDVNGDYRPDIYVSNDFWERDYLYINQGDGSFSEELTSRTSSVSQASMGSDMGDINNDGLMDIFTTDMLPVDAARIKTMTVFEEYRPDNEQFHGSYHHQYVQNTLQLNNGNGTFSETAFLSGVAATDWSWGALLFDFDNDGWEDIFVSNGIYQDLTDKDFRNFLSDRSNIARMVRERGKFNVSDFLQKIPSQKIKNAAFTNNRDKTFTQRSDSLGFEEPTFSNGSAYGDLDNDGDLDLVINDLNGPALIYRNEIEKYNKNHYLKISFKGSGNNSRGIGAIAKIYVNGQQQLAENITSRSFQSAVSARVHFGLGSQSSVDSLVVVWPNRQKQVIKNVIANQEIEVRQSAALQPAVKKPLGASQPSGTEASEEPAGAEASGQTGSEESGKSGSDGNAPSASSASSMKQTPVLTDQTPDHITGNIRHRENDYNDFDQCPLLPRMFSNTGPTLAKGDIDGDGQDDFLVTGASNDQDKLFIQQSGIFRPKLYPDLAEDSLYESTAAAFFDIDGDNDLDLMIGSGGNQQGNDALDTQIRTYENTGGGVLSRSADMAPGIRMEASAIIPNDFDNDGDTDVFLGARLTPGAYGVPPQSYLLQNDGQGNWTDVTPDKLKKAGMISDAVWSDYNGDGQTDLIAAGEWMPVMFFKNTDGRLTHDYSVKNSRGWWSAIEETDLDSDGDMDYVVGNWGQNSTFQATPQKPLSMQVNDFNGDGTTEFLISTYRPGAEEAYPFPTYDDLLAEIPFLAERLPNHHAYAQKTYEDIFTAEERKGARQLKTETLQTSLLVNNDGKFELRPLPPEAQISPVYGIIAEDFNSDGTTDLLLLGNQHGLKPEVGRLADNYGVFLFNDGNLDYSYVPYTETGVSIRGEVRDASKINIGDEQFIIITRNDDELMIMKQ
jgi:hypothetical protein